MKYGPVRMVRLQELGFEDQLKLMLNTGIMIAAHVSAGALMVFCHLELWL